MQLWLACKLLYRTEWPFAGIKSVSHQADRYWIFIKLGLKSLNFHGGNRIQCYNLTGHSGTLHSSLVTPLVSLIKLR